MIIPLSMIFTVYFLPPPCLHYRSLADNRFQPERLGTLG